MLGFLIDEARAAARVGRDAIRRLFPPELRAYIPGGKLIAGAVAYVLADVVGLGPETFVELPGVNFSLDVEEFAAFVGFYFWPGRSSD